MAENDKLGDFFAKKKAKKKFVLKEKKTSGKTTDLVSGNTKSISNDEQDTGNTKKCDESGWIEIQQEKKNVIQTAGKTLAELGNLIDEEEQSINADLEKDDTKNMFHWARSSVKKKTKKSSDQQEETPPQSGLGGLRRLQARRAGAGVKLEVDSERQFPSLGGCQTTGQQPKLQASSKPIEVHNAWANFIAESDSEEEDVSKSNPSNPDTKLSMNELKEELPQLQTEKKLEPEPVKVALPQVDESDMARFQGMKKKKKKPTPQ